MYRHKLSISAPSVFLLVAAGCVDDPSYVETSAGTIDTSQDTDSSGMMDTSGTSAETSGTGDTGDETETGGTTGEIPEPPEPVGNNILVRVISSETQEGVYNARLKIGEEYVHTDSGGYALINDLEVDTSVLIKIAARGYIPASRRVAVADELAAYIEVEVIPEAEPQYFMASQGATIETEGVSVKIAPGTLVDQFNQPAEGMVEAVVTPVPPQSTPAPLRGIDEEGVEANLVSFGMGSFTFRQGDNELQLAEGAYADIGLPLPPNTMLGEGMQVPLWWLNEETGEWEEEQQGTVVIENGELRYEATARHFSTYNIDNVIRDQDAQCWVVVIREDGQQVSRSFSVEGQSEDEGNFFVSGGWFGDSGVSHALYNYNWTASGLSGTQGNCVVAPVGAQAPLFIQGEPTEHVLTDGGAGGCWGNQYPDWINPECQLVEIDINTAPECNTPNSPALCADEQLASYPYPDQLGNGQCILGTKWCVGGSWSDCSDWVGPADFDDCSQEPLTDDDCNGIVEADACMCDDSSWTDTRPCYDDYSVLHTVNVGNCRYGTSTCLPGGWGSCNAPTADDADPPLADPGHMPQTGPIDIFCGDETMEMGDQNCDGFIGCSGEIQWSAALGSAQPSTVAGVDVAVHTGSNPGIYVAGTFNQELSSLPAGFLNLDGEIPVANDVMLVKYDTDIDNTPLWAVIIEEGGDDLVEAVAVDGNGNAYIAGAYSASLVIKDVDGVSEAMWPAATNGSYDIFVVQIMANGQRGWVKTFNGPGYDSALDIKVCPENSICDGDVVVVGTADADDGEVFADVPAAGQNHGNDAFLISLDIGNDGDLVGGEMYGTAGTDYFSAVTIGGAYVVAGRTLNSINFDGPSVDGGGVGAGFAAQLNADLDGTWATSFRGSFGGRANDVASNLLDGSDYIYVAGNYRGAGAFVDDGVQTQLDPSVMDSQDIVAVKLQWSDGTIVGDPQTIGSAGTDDATGIQVQNGDASIFLTGFFEDSATFTAPLNSQGGTDIFVMKYNSNFDWSINYGAAGDDVANAGFLDPEPGGKFYVVGSFINTVSFGETIYPNMDGGSDLFVLKQNQ